MVSWVGFRRGICRVDTIAVCGLLAVSQNVQAREKDPELPAMECPIEAPVRVASDRSLAQFSGLLEDCTNLAVIVAPATQANKPADTTRSIPAGGIDDLENGYWDESGGDTRVIARNSGARDTAQTTQVRRSSGGSVVAIVPPPVTEPLIAISASNATTQLAIEHDDGSVEAILALRPRSYSTPFDNEIASAARRHAVDPLLLHAVITQESRYRHRAVSPAGARGLMQVMPQTGRGLGVHNADLLFDARTNIDAGARLLKSLWARFGGRLDLVLAAYNAGEGAVRKYGMTVPPYRETRDYVVKVRAAYTKLAGESGIAANLN